MRNAGTKVRNGQRLLYFEAQLPQPASHGSRVKIEVEGGEFHGLQRERIPGLPSRPVAQHGLGIALVRKFQKEYPLWPEHVANLGQDPGCICHMMQHPDHGGRIEQAFYERQVIGVRGDIDIPVNCLAGPVLVGVG